nr:ribonuclease H-like domain-containing protein [Tanacetum cinerariifolium]
DFWTRHILLRCDNSGDLYPATKPSTIPTALLSTSSSTWYQRLGHPGDKVLRSLASRQFNSCNKEMSSHVCYACQLGKHVKLPFHSGLQYLTFTRRDISYAVRPICLYMHDPRKPHHDVLKRILRYIQGTLDFGFHLYSSTTISLVGYTDADWAGCPSTRRSTSAETAWLHNLLRELHFPLSAATLVYYDNVSATYVSANPIQHQQTKHIEIDIHFVCDLVTAGQV